MNVTILDHGSSLTIEVSYKDLLTMLRKALPALTGKVHITEIEADSESVEITIRKWLKEGTHD